MITDVLSTDPEQRILLRGALRWVKAYWVLALVIVLGLTRFSDAIATSIASTPHPALVYTIFAVATVAAVLSGLLLATLVREIAWYERLIGRPSAERLAMIARRDAADDLSPLYHLTIQTSQLPLGQRKQALDHELDCAEATMMGRAALPSLLSGSLVGIGLVGTFIGLLGTLHDLSGVFSAFGGTDGNTAATFSTMIQKLRGPIQGMGTAFVASLYGLLGSLVIGLVVLSVRRVGDELFTALRLFVSEELYLGGAQLSTEPVEGESELGSSMRILAAVTREEHGKLREGMEQWSQALDERLAKVASITASIGAEVKDAADYVGSAARRSVDSLEKARETNERLFFGMNEVSKGLIERLDTLNRELSDASGRPSRQVAVVALALALLALGTVLGTLLGARTPPAPPPAAVASRAAAAIAPTPVAQAAPAAAGAEGAATAVQAAGDGASRPAGDRTVPGAAVVVARRGDTLSRLAAENGVALDDLVTANPQIRNTDAVQVGDVVQLPPR